jgi:hypothetical protein
MPGVEFACSGAEESVSVADSWAGWAAQPLARQGEDWTGRLELPAGRHHYKVIMHREKPHCVMCATNPLPKLHVIYVMKPLVQAGDLKKHKLVHTGENRYFCDFCDKSFA